MTKDRKTSGLTIKRIFTKIGENPLDHVKYEKRTCVITDKDGKEVFRGEGEVPIGWSQLASNILISKYLRRAGLYGYKNQKETSARQAVYRIAHTIRRTGQTLGGYFASDDDADSFEAELSYMLINQYGAFNSPVWFNCGLFHEYGINGSPPGHAWDIETDDDICKIENAYLRPQCSACFISSVDDDLMSIYDLLKTEGHIFKHGSGTGTNFSTLRGHQENLSGGGKSSGLMNFLEVLDRAAGAIKSGGTTRRAAKIACLDMDHPEIESFITWKVREELKAIAMIEAGYDSDFNGEACHTISGQNTNTSVRATDHFMKAAIGQERPDIWHTVARTTGDNVDCYKASELWNMIAEAAWKCGDPGVQFEDSINRMNTCGVSGRIRSSNPCGELLFIDNSACNLASLNLTKLFDDKNGVFSIDSICQAVRVFIIAQDILVDLSSYPTREIAYNTRRHRPLGLGYCNLGAHLMRMGIPYDSILARDTAAEITSLMTAEAYRVSGELALSLGAFLGHEKNKNVMKDVILRHCDNESTRNEVSALSDVTRNIWTTVAKMAEGKGFRNAQVTLLAPTGTIGLLMDCDTTGIEPDFSLIKSKKLAGGGSFTIVNQSVAPGLRALGYEERDIDILIDYLEHNGTLEGSMLLDNSHLHVFDCASRCCQGGSRMLDPMSHLKMLAAVQPFLSGGISKTVNLPNEATVDDVKEIYEQAWKMGLKSITVYRDGSKVSQPLQVVAKSTESKRSPHPIGSRVRLPHKRTGFTQEAKIGGHKLFLRTGEYPDGALGEIFLDMHKEGAAFRSLTNCFAMAISVGLQYGVPLETYVKQFTFTRFEPQGIVEGHDKIKMATSLIDYIFRVLGIEYLGWSNLGHVHDQNEETTKKQESVVSDAPMCNTCGHVTVRNGTCYRCLNCGSSLGCS